MAVGFPRTRGDRSGIPDRKEGRQTGNDQRSASNSSCWDRSPSCPDPASRVGGHIGKNWARELSTLGVATFIVDSFTGRVRWMARW